MLEIINLSERFPGICVEVDRTPKFIYLKAIRSWPPVLDDRLGISFQFSTEAMQKDVDLLAREIEAAVQVFKSRRNT